MEETNKPQNIEELSREIQEESKRISVNIDSYTDKILRQYPFMGLERLKANTCMKLADLLHLNIKYSFATGNSHPAYDPCAVKVESFVNKLIEVTDSMRGE